jgi:hypothetical protein
MPVNGNDNVRYPRRYRGSSQFLVGILSYPRADSSDVGRPWLD